VVLDIEGEEKKNLKVEDLLERFSRLRGDEGVSDRMLLG
jgi:putative ABC transport system ATP-binding protein